MVACPLRRLEPPAQTWRRPDRTLMPAFGQRLTDDEIAATLAFIKSTWPADIRARQARRSLKSANPPH